MVQIVVRGEAVGRAGAERASVTVRSRWQAETPEQARELVVRAHARVVEDARGFADSGAADWWRADDVWLSHHEEWMGEGQPRRAVFVAAASVTVRFVDTEVLGTWIADLGGEAVHEIGGIEWSLAEETERELARTARADALADAVARADDYARSARLGAPAITSIREPGAGESTAPMAKGEAVMLRAAATAEAPTIALEPGDIEVRAAVDVAFEAPSGAVSATDGGAGRD